MYIRIDNRVVVPSLTLLEKSTNIKIDVILVIQWRYLQTPFYDGKWYGASNSGRQSITESDRLKYFRNM